MNNVEKDTRSSISSPLSALHLRNRRCRPEFAGRVGAANDEPEEERLGDEREDLVDFLAVEVATRSQVFVGVASVAHVLFETKT